MQLRTYTLQYNKLKLDVIMELGNKGIIHGQHTHSLGSMSLFMSAVYRWMTMGVAMTALIAYIIAQDEQLLMTIVTNKILFYGCIIAEFGLVIYLSARIQKMSASAAIMAFIVYAALNGVTFSIFSVIYTGASIQNAFIAAACSFAGLSLFGLLTKRDLGPIGTFCHMALWGLVIFGVISMFVPGLRDGQMGMIYSAGGILIFAGLTAYDTQKIKSYASLHPEGSEGATKYQIMGALTLYLDFINLFLFILRLMGRRR